MKIGPMTISTTMMTMTAVMIAGAIVKHIAADFMMRDVTIKRHLAEIQPHNTLTAYVKRALCRQMEPHAPKRDLILQK